MNLKNRSKRFYELLGTVLGVVSLLLILLVPGLIFTYLFDSYLFLLIGPLAVVVLKVIQLLNKVQI